MIYDDELTLNDRTQMLWDEVFDAEPMAAESVEDIKTAINKAIEAENEPAIAAYLIGNSIFVL